MGKVSKKICLAVSMIILISSSFIEFGATTAEARIGGGRSVGRSSGFGSRPNSSNRSSGSSGQYNRPEQAPPQNASPSAAPAPVGANRGGFLRNVAGGMAGGFLGSMLFSSLGNAGGYGDSRGGGGAGLIEILLLAGVAYFGFRWWKNRRQITTIETSNHAFQNTGEFTNTENARANHLTVNPKWTTNPAGIDTDTASDIFFKVQGAWTRRDLSTVRGILDKDIESVFERDLADLKRKEQINRLENISVRRTEILHTWEDSNTEYSSVRFTANLLDYTTNEKTGQVVEGSDSLPVKFEEDWTFAKSPGNAGWQLSGIQQV